MSYNQLFYSTESVDQAMLIRGGIKKTSTVIVTGNNTDGYVGINTDTPSGRLHIKDSETSAGIIIQANIKYPQENISWKNIDKVESDFGYKIGKDKNKYYTRKFNFVETCQHNTIRYRKENYPINTNLDSIHSVSNFYNTCI